MKLRILIVTSAWSPRNSIGARDGLPVIEGDEQSLRAQRLEPQILKFVDISCIRFCPSKPLASYGERGAIFTSGRLVCHGHPPDRPPRTGPAPSAYPRRFNSLLDTSQAVILLPNLAIFDDDFSARERVAEPYDAALTGLATPYIAQDCQSIWAQNTMLVPNRSAVQVALKVAIIPTAVHYPLPLNHQPAVADTGADLPEGDRATEEVISLQMHPYMNVATVQLVAMAVVV